MPQGERTDQLLYHLYRSTKPLTSTEGVRPLITVERETRYVDSPAEEGEYHYAIVAEDLAGNRSPLKTAATIASDTTPPPAPSALTARLDKQVLLSWTASAEKGARHRVYRALSPSELTQPRNRIAEDLAEATHSDLPKADGTYHYAVTAIDAAGNESAPSNVAIVEFVGRVPRATIVTEPKGIVRAAFKVTLTSTLPLAEPPQLFLQTTGRSDPIPLRKLGGEGTRWEGNFDLPKEYPDGRATFSFRGVASGGYAGTGIDAGEELIVDTRPPSVRLTLSKPSPLADGTHEVTVTADEPLASVPQLLLTTLGAKPRAVELQKVDDQVYRGRFVVGTEDRDGTAVFAFVGTDRAGNEARLEHLEPFQIDHHPPRPPTALKTRTLAGGEIELSWQAPVNQASEPFDQIAGYNVYRSDRPIESLKDLVPAKVGVRQISITDRPEKDGEYHYAVVTLDASGLISAPTQSVKALSRRTPPQPPRIVELKQVPTGIGIAWESDEPAATAPATGPATAPAGARFTVHAWTEGQRDPVVVVKDFAGRRTEYRPLISGVYSFRVSVLDAFGNESAPSIPQSLEYQQLAPVAKLAFSRPVPWGEGPVEITLTANRPLPVAPTLVLATGEKGEKLIPVPLAGSGVTWKGQLAAEKSFGAEQGEFRFRAVVKEQGADLEGTGILEGREARFDFTPPTLSVNFGPSVPIKDRRALLATGRHELVVESSEHLREAPRLLFTPQGKPPVALTLTADAGSVSPRKWSATLVVDEKLGDGAALLEFEGTDLRGNVGKQITQGQNVLVRTHAPNPVSKLRAVSMPGGRVRLDWTPPLLPSGEPDGSANHFRLYRSESEIRSVEGMTPLTELYRNLGHIDAPSLDRDYFYTVVAVDEAGNISSPATSVSVHVDKTPPGQPRELVVSELPTGAVKLSWKAPTGEAATYYRVYLEKFPIRSTRGLHPQSDCVPFTQIYGTPNENGKYYFAVTAVDQALNESQPSESVFLDYKTIAPMAFFSIARGEQAEQLQGSLTVHTASQLTLPPQLLVKGPTGEPRRVSLVGDGQTWSARIAPAALFQLQGTGSGATRPTTGEASAPAAGADTTYTLDLLTASPLPEPPRVYFQTNAGEPKPIAFGGRDRQFAARLEPRTFFRYDPRIWLTDGRYTVTVWTTQPLAAPPKVTVHSEHPSRAPAALPFTGSGDTWRAVLDVDSAMPEGQYGFIFEGADAHGNLGTEIREGPLFRVDRTPPLPPEKPQAVGDDAAGPGAVKVSWSPPQQGGAEIPHYYRIYRSAAEFTDPAKADLVHVFRVTHEGRDREEITDVPPENGQWFYRVTSLDLAGNESPAGELAKVSVSTTTPRAWIRLSTPQSGDAAAERVGRAGAKIVLTTNVPLQAAPKLSWFLKSKPQDRHDVALSGEGARFEGALDLHLPQDADLEEDAEFSFAGVAKDGGTEGTQIRSGQAFVVDSQGPEARIIIPSVYEMKIVAKPKGGGELKVSPVKGGRIEVSVELSETSADVPELRYTLDDGRPVPVPLTGFARQWRGWMDIPPGIVAAKGRFQFKAIDVAGNVSTKITRREYPREVDETSDPPQTLRNFATTGGEFEVDSAPPPPPRTLTLTSRKLGVVEAKWEAPQDGAWTYRLYRSLTPIVGGVPPANQAVKNEILARVMVDDPPTDGTWFYAVTAVDLAGNESALSESPSLFVDSIKPELKIKAVTDGDDFVILFPEEEPPTAEVTLRFPGQKDFQVSLGGDSGQLKRVVREVNGRPVPGYVMPRRAEFFNGKVEVIVHSPDPEGNQVQAITETSFRKINAATGGEVESADGGVKLEIPAGIEPVIPAGPKEFKRVGGYDKLFFISYERVPQTAAEAAKSQDPRLPDPIPPGLTVVGTPYTIELNQAPKEPMEFKSAATQADLSSLKALMPKLTMKIPETYSDVAKDPEYLKTRLKVVKWVPTPGNAKSRGRWEMVPDIEVKPETNELVTLADSVTTYVIVSERTPPSVLDATPEPNGSTRALKPAISARIVDKGTGVATGAENAIVLSIDGQKIPAGLVKLSTGDPTEVQLSYEPPADLKPGTHLASIRAEDVVGNVASYQWRFNIDDQPPAVTALRPAEGSGIGVRRPTVSAVLSDEGDIDIGKTRLRLDGADIPAADLRFDEASGLLNWMPTSDLAGGEHRVELIAADRTGQTTNRSWNFAIDDEAPEFELPEVRGGTVQLRLHDRMSALDESRIVLVVNNKPTCRTVRLAEGGFTWDHSTQVLTYPLPADVGQRRFTMTASAQDEWGNHRSASWSLAVGGPVLAVGPSGEPEPRTRPTRLVERATTQPATSPHLAQSGGEVAPAAPMPAPSRSTWVWELIVTIIVIAIGVAGFIMWRKRRAPKAMSGSASGKRIE